MKQFTLMLAWRLLYGGRHQRSISTMIIISVCSIIIGTMALALVFSIMHGFEMATQEKLQNIHPQIIIDANGRTLKFDKLNEVIRTEFPQVAAVSPTAMQHVLIQTPLHDGLDTVVFMKGIDPEREDGVTHFASKIVKPTGASLPSVLSDDQIIIGKKLAERLDISVGDAIDLLFAQKSSGRSAKFNDRPAHVGAIFSTGIDEFDNNGIISSLSFMQKLFPATEPTQLGVRLVSNAPEQETITALQRRLGLQVVPWHELYPALLSALKLEKYVMFIIVALIMIVATMNTLALMFMLITYRRSMIALLCAMGCTRGMIMRIFYTMGIILSTIASVIGLILAWIIGWFLQVYPLIELPDVYYVTHIPVELSLTTFIAIGLFVVGVSACAIWLPLRSIKQLNCANLLRFE